MISGRYSFGTEKLYIMSHMQNIDVKLKCKLSREKSQCQLKLSPPHSMASGRPKSSPMIS